MHNLVNRISNKIQLNISEIGKKYRKKIRNESERKNIKNKDFSIITNNCIGGVICNDLKRKFLTPTINLYIKPVDFVEFLENLEVYLKMEIQPIETKLSYPVGKLGDITIFFKHYKNIETAIQKWEERKKRINFDNLFIIMTDRWCCPYEYLQRFDNLKYTNKVCFTAKEYKEFKSCKLIKKRSNAYCVGVITNVVNIFGKRLYQYAKEFDYIQWLNKESRDWL